VSKYSDPSRPARWGPEATLHSRPQRDQAGGAWQGYWVITSMHVSASTRPIDQRNLPISWAFRTSSAIVAITSNSGLPTGSLDLEG
jgi:hypothetical protein